MQAGSYLRQAANHVLGLFHKAQLSPEHALILTPTLDPLLRPKAPMSNANLDVGLLTALSSEGMKRAKEITIESHPELIRAWGTMCRRAGLNRVPQLILAESKAVNAASLSDQNAVVVTTALFQRMTFAEVCAVLGHELGHESSEHTKPRVKAMAAFGGAGLVLGDALAHAGGIGRFLPLHKLVDGKLKNLLHYLLGGEGKPVSMLGYAYHIFLTAGAGLIVANKTTVHPTELEADRKGTAISGDPQALLSLLHKLEDARGQKTFGKWFRWFRSGYPTMDERYQQIEQIIASKLPEEPVSAAVLRTPVEPLPPPAHAPASQISQVQEASRVQTPELATALS